MGSSTDEAPSPRALLYPSREPVVSNARVTCRDGEVGTEFVRMIRKSSQLLSQWELPMKLLPVGRW